MIGWVGAVLGLILATISGNAVTGYFVSVAVATAYLAPVGILISQFQEMGQMRTAIVAFLGVEVGWLSYWAVRFVNGSSDFELVARIVLPSPLIWVGVCGVAAGALVVMRVVPWHAATRFVLIGALFVSVGANVASINRLDVGGELDSSAIDVAIGEPLEREVAAWIDGNTPRDAVFATNRFCANCKGREWFERDYALIGEDHNFVPTDSKLGGGDFRLTSLSRRRFLIQGPWYLFVNGHPIEKAATRVRLSLEFANNPSARSHQELANRGVGYFVVDTLLTDVGDWAPWGDIQFRNGRYVVLRLT